MPVEGLAGNTQLLAEPSDLGLRLTHRRYCQSQLRRRHLEGSTAFTPADPRRGKSCHRTFGDQLALELCEPYRQKTDGMLVFQAGEDRSDLAQALRLSWLPKMTEGFFMRAESFYNFTSYLDGVSGRTASARHPPEMPVSCLALSSATV